MVACGYIRITAMNQIMVSACISDNIYSNFIIQLAYIIKKLLKKAYALPLLSSMIVNKILGCHRVD